MKALLLRVVQILSASWLEYRFNREYGDNFFDYSLNGRYGQNGMKSGTFKVKNTDRGIYLEDGSRHLKVNGDLYLPSVLSISVWLMATNSYFSGFYCFNDNSGFAFGRKMEGSTASLIAEAEGVIETVNGNNECFPYGKCNIEEWVLETLTYSNDNYKIYINESPCLTFSIFLINTDPYVCGYGVANTLPSLGGFVWNIKVNDIIISISTLISTSGSSTCLLGENSCTACAVAFNDPNLGVGCITKNMDSNKNAFGETCNADLCSKTMSLNCPSIYSFCTYDQTTNKCLILQILSELTSEPADELSCTCKAPFILTDNSCCSASCQNCNFLGECPDCYSNNAEISAGTCICKQGFYSKGDFSKIDNCVACTEGCLSCSSTLCDFCSPNSSPSGKNCFCNVKFFGSPSNCQPCSGGCEVCTDMNSCSLCSHLNAEVREGYCKCKGGFYGDGGNCTACHRSCKLCYNDVDCIECFVDNTYSDSGMCFCKEGYFGDPLSFCQACDVTCKKCKSLSNCLECNDEHGLKNGGVCECTPGYFQNSLKACEKCASGCSVCESLNSCSSCNVINSIIFQGVCICKDGYFKSDTENSFECLHCLIGCEKCPELCTSCDESLICSKCVNNSNLIDGECFCNRGFKMNGSHCETQYFYGNLIITKSNRLILYFTEELDKNLTANDLQLIIKESELKLEIYSKNSSHYILKADIRSFSAIDEDIVLTILKDDVFSKNNSILFNHTFSGKLQPYISEDEATILGINAGAGTKVVISLAVSSSLISNPTALWSLMNTIQLIIILPLNSVPYPKKLKKISSSLIDYNIIPNLFEYIVSPNCTSAPYKNAYDYGIVSSVLLINAGKLFMILGFSLLSLIIILFALDLCISPEKHKKMKSKYKFNILLRFWIQCYLELGLFAIIQLKSEINILIGGYVNMCIALLIGFFFVFSPFFLFVLMKMKENKLNSESFKLKLGCLVNEFKNNKGILSSLYYPLFLLRRLEYILVQVFLIEFPLAQVLLNCVFSLMILLFLIYYRPFKDRQSLIAVFSGELSVNVVFICAVLFLLREGHSDINTYENIAIYSIFSALLVQVLVSIYNIGKKIKCWYCELEKARALTFSRRVQNNHISLDQYDIQGNITMENNIVS